MLLPILFASALTIVSSNPLPAAAAAPAPQASVIPTSRTYNLKTVSSNPAFSSLYVEAYHTGAGFNDAVLVSSGPDNVFANGFLNGTQQEFNLGDDFPWGMVMEYAPYGAWGGVEINAGLGSGGFYFNNTDGTGKEGLKWASGWPYTLAGSPENEFNGWLGEISRSSATVH